jgi:sialic acid synthase SpsE
MKIVAELSCNHLGSRERAFRIADAAANAGADMFKVQVWSPDTMCVDRGYTLEHGPWAGRRLFDLYQEAFTPWEWLPGLFAYCRKLGVEPFGAAFDAESVDYLCSLGVERLKVASFELVDIPLIRYMASKGKPMILSTGMATLMEIDSAIYWSEPCPVTILACTSVYPAKPKDANLAAAVANYGASWGLSDHSMGIGVAVSAAALGAVMIEKHLTLSRSDGGPDAGFSMEPAEFAQMVTECRRAAAAVGEVKYGPGPNESTALRRSLWVVKDTKAGEPLILGQNVRTARPALGLPCDTPLTRAAVDLKAGEPLVSASLDKA